VLSLLFLPTCVPSSLKLPSLLPSFLPPGLVNFSTRRLEGVEASVDGVALCFLSLAASVDLAAREGVFLSKRLHACVLLFFFPPALEASVKNTLLGFFWHVRGAFPWAIAFPIPVTGRLFSN